MFLALNPVLLFKKNESNNALSPYWFSTQPCIENKISLKTRVIFEVGLNGYGRGEGYNFKDWAFTCPVPLKIQLLHARIWEQSSSNMLPRASFCHACNVHSSRVPCKLRGWIWHFRHHRMADCFESAALTCGGCLFCQLPGKEQSQAKHTTACGAVPEMLCWQPDMFTFHCALDRPGQQTETTAPPTDSGFG